MLNLKEKEGSKSSINLHVLSLSASMLPDLIV